ncbi:hypothetical protein HYH02_013031 [Chlamydomonas schloesseri]|uniref:Uncharacterized protein n=1 Tax=Chlamydomonas schloesseri TaxID=2026947 RepID=A0A835W170_9CHLO|nr:hypothetical protein HYH02_013031 [Chlamydomonas schloesseri]|eukprot:KAG2432311.1 hypothetical protein HYH02_013031 [Chlamydomonas schloesseri]
MVLAMARPGRGSSGGQKQQQSAAAGASTSQQPRNGPSKQQAPLITDLIIQRLEAAGDVQSVLQLIKQPRPAAAAEPAFVYTVALNSLARLLSLLPSVGAAGTGRGSGPQSKEELQQLQDAVRGMVSELHSRRGMLSFPLLSVALTSLEVLLPALGGSWRAAGVRPDDAAGRLLELVAELPRAAADADRVQLVPLPALRDAFRAALRLTQMAQPLLQQQASSAAPGRPGPVAQQQVVGQEVRAYLRRAVFATAGGSDDAGGQAETAAAVDAAAAAARLQGADLAAMAAAAELAVMWDMEVAPAVMQLHVRHVDRLLAAAAAGPAYPPNDNVEGQVAASGEPAEHGGRTGGRGRARGPATTRSRSSADAQPLPDGLVVAGQLDVTSLAQLLVAWASVPAGRHAPSAEWLDRAAALALRTQDRIVMGKRAQLLRNLDNVRAEQQQAEQQLQQLKETVPGGQARCQVQAEEEGDDVKLVDDGGEDEESFGLPCQKAEEELLPPPERVRNLTARLQRIGRDIEARELALAALGPAAVAPCAASADSAAAAGPVTQSAGKDKRLRPQADTAAGATGTPAAPAAKRARADRPHQEQPRQRSHFTSPQQLIAVLYALGRMRSVPSREEVGEFTKRLRPHLESLPPADAVRLLHALEALGYNPPARPWQRQPQPQRRMATSQQLSKKPNASNSKATSSREVVDEISAPSGAEVVGRLMVMVDALLGAQLGGSSIASSAGLEPGARGLAAAPSGLILQLLRSCAAWSVPFPEEFMGALEIVVEQRVLRSLPPDQIQMLSARAVANATLTNRGGSRAGPTAALQAAPSVADANADAMRLGLLEGVILPLAATRQGFANGDMFYLALRDWSEVESWKGLTVEKATSLLNAFAYSKSWALVPQLRKAVEGLMERALRLPVSTPHEASGLLLAVGRALRVMGDKMQCTPGEAIVDKVAPSVVPLLMPAMEQLVRLGPSMPDVAAVAKGLLVEARWHVPGADDDLGRAGGGGCSALGSEQATRRLLVGLLAAAIAEPKTEQMGVSHVAWLLEGFAALQYRPPHDMMAQLYSAAAERLAERPSKAEEVVELLNSVTGMDGVLPSEASPAPATPGSAGGRRASAADESKARGRLLQQLAMAALREPALPALASAPESLVAAVRQMAALGLRPQAQWLLNYTTVVQAVLPELSPTGLAYAAEGMALLGAAPPSAFLDILLTNADKHGADRFDPQALGLLLGGAHALRQNALAAQAAAERRLRGFDDDSEEGAKLANNDDAGIDPAALMRRQAAAGMPMVAPLSKAAVDAWGRAHAAFVSEARKSNPMPRYSRAQQLLVVSAVVSFELSRPPLSQQAPAAAGGRGKSPGKAGATADFRARLEADWLAETCASLLVSRKTLELSGAADGNGGSSSAALLPTPALLVDLLRLASRVLRGRVDGGIDWLAAIPTSSPIASLQSGEEGPTEKAAAAQGVLSFVQLSIQDLFGSTAGSQRTAAAALPSWLRLLRAALAAGVSLSPAELRVYTAALLDTAAKVTRRALTKGANGGASTHRKRSGTSADQALLSPEGGELMSAVWRDVEEGLEGVLLPVLPWVPPDETLKTLRLGLLEQPPSVLTAASLRQLALLCTYTTQAAPQLAAEAVGAKRTAWWSNVRADLLRRAQEEEVEKAWSKVQRGASSTASSAAGEEAALQTAGDLAAVCYGLLMHGSGSGGGREGQASGLRSSSGAELPPELATWMRLLLTRASSATAADTSCIPSSREGLAGVRALQLLWVARAVGCLHLVPDSVWAAAFGARGPEQTGAPALQLRQVVQLVVLRAEAVRAYSSSPQQQQPPPSAESWFVEVWLGRLTTAVRKTLQAKRPSRGGGLGPDADGITPGVAALAVAYCLPPAERPPAYAVALAEAALPALGAAAGPGGAAAASADQALSLADVWAFVQRVESWPVAAASAGAGSNAAGSYGDGIARWTGLPAEAVSAVCLRLLVAVEQRRDEAGSALRPSEIVPFAVTLLNAAAVTDGSPAVLEAALPLLQALVPDAEHEVWALAAHERLGRAVMASALQAGLNAVTNTEPPLGADGALTSASEVAAVMAGSVAVLLQLQDQRPQVAVAGKSGSAAPAAAQSPLDVRGLSPDQLAPLASAIIRLCSPATSIRVSGAISAIIPRAATAVLLRLLSTAGVVERLPAMRLEAAITRFLHSQRQTEACPALPMTEPVAQAISDKLLQVGSTAGVTRTPTQLACLLNCCGASGVLLQRTLLADRKWAGRESELLQALALAAPREPLALSLRMQDFAREFDQSDVDQILNRGEGTCGRLVVELLRSLDLGAEERRVSLREAAAALSAAAAVVPHLEGLNTTFIRPLAGKVAGGALMYLPDRARQETRKDPAVVWQLLEALFTLGGGTLNWQAYVVTAQEAAAGALEADAQTSTLQRLTRSGQELVDEFSLINAAVAGLGPYLLRYKAARELQECCKPLVGRHNKRMEELLRGKHSKAAGTAAGAFWWPPGSGQPPPGPLASGLRLPEEDPDLLSARQLGLLYGAVAVRGSGAMEGVPYDAVAAEAKELHLAYVTSLNLLAGRTDLPPHQHLDAMLAALEPAIFVAVSTVVPPVSNGWKAEDFYNERLPFERLLAPVLARYATASSAEQPRPAGVQLMDDVTTAYGVAVIDERSMAAALYGLLRSSQQPEGPSTAATAISGGSAGGAGVATRGAAGAEASSDVDLMRFAAVAATNSLLQQDAPWVVLPTHLRPPPGRRHGQPGGDAAADAAREAYVRSVAPSLALLQRLVRVLALTGRVPAARHALKSQASFTGFGNGRWAQLLEYIIDKEAVTMRMLKQALIPELQALLPRPAADALTQLFQPGQQAAGNSSGGGWHQFTTAAHDSSKGSVAGTVDSGGAASQEQAQERTTPSGGQQGLEPEQVGAERISPVEAEAEAGPTPPPLPAAGSPDKVFSGGPGAVTGGPSLQTPSLPPFLIQRQEQQPASSNVAQAVLGAAARLGGAMGSLLGSAAKAASDSVRSGLDNLAAVREELYWQAWVMSVLSERLEGEEDREALVLDTLRRLGPLHLDGSGEPVRPETVIKAYEAELRARKKAKGRGLPKAGGKRSQKGFGQGS